MTKKIGDNDRRVKLYEYGAIVQNAKLDCTAKALLWFYAYTYNWTEKRDSYYAQRKICAQVGMSQSTYQKKRKYLEHLGWIKVVRRGYKDTCLVKVMVGKDDPDYEKMSWAEWHPSNKPNRYQFPNDEPISEESMEPGIESELDISEQTIASATYDDSESNPIRTYWEKDWLD